MTPSTFLIHVVLCSLAILALWNTFQPGEVFSGIGSLVRRKTPRKVEKPTVDCPVCMASIYGTAYFVVFLWPQDNWWMRIATWILFVLCVSGLNRLVVLLPLKR